MDSEIVQLLKNESFDAIYFCQWLYFITYVVIAKIVEPLDAMSSLSYAAFLDETNTIKKIVRWLHVISRFGETKRPVSKNSITVSWLQTKTNVR